MYGSCLRKRVMVFRALMLLATERARSEIAAVSADIPKGIIRTLVFVCISLALTLVFGALAISGLRAPRTQGLGVSS